MNKFYITTAIPYVNAPPHIGHALEFIETDVINRYHKILGDETLLLSGADENALKNVQAADKEKITVQELVDKNSKLFQDLAKKLNVNFDVFQRGSNPQHHLSSQKLWELCDKKGDIYKKEYSGKYCVGCELFYGKEELTEKGECFEHPGRPLEEVTEENYFFKLSKYENQIKQLIESNKLKIVPSNRRNEVLSFISQGLKDISISRSNDRAKNWGVKIPGDGTQKMYVWFDALNIYRSGVENNDSWPADLHVIGKGITRFHAVYWPAFLLSARLKLPKKLLIHEYITVNGQKMSKTVGNVLDPIPLIEKYGADLANVLGNLVSRVARLCERSNFNIGDINRTKYGIDSGVKRALEEYRFDEALRLLWEHINASNAVIDELKPWKLKDKELAEGLNRILSYISFVDYFVPNLKIFLPETAEKIKGQFKGPKITSQPPLFPRI
jgi:methionyl-tRNA synthetase